MTAVKICGLSTPETLSAALNAGVDYVGFVFYPPSPRHVEIDTAKALASQIATNARAVGLFVDPTDDQLSEALSHVPIDIIQLHGNETPQRVAEIKERYRNLDVMKAIRIRNADDLNAVQDYEATADWLLFDTKSEKAPGGTGEKFDWSLLKGKTFAKPWMLSGGLTAENTKDALAQLSPDALDVSSGVESAPGIKDPVKIKAFIDSVKTAI